MSAVPFRQLARTKIFHFKEGDLTDFDNVEDRQSLIILGDLLNDIYSNDVCDIFYIYHRNISVILITQNLFHQSR